MRLTRLLTRMRFIDIGANLTDSMYSGEYNGSSRHPEDLKAVLQRAETAGVEKMMVTGGNLEESRQVLDVKQSHEVLGFRLHTFKSLFSWPEAMI